MIPKGFKVGGVHCGISNKKAKLDLALFLTQNDANVGAVFTNNLVKAAPVIFDIERLKKSKKISAIIANSGCANACTGQEGLKDAVSMAQAVEKNFGLSQKSVLCCSTGVIGQRLNLKGFKQALENLKTVLGEAEECQKNAVSAIMTTDTVIKKTSQTINLDGNKITIWACVKGSGMIAPDLRGFHATMLAFILTDANISNANLQKLLENSVKQSFNCVTVDGDTSTNDTVIILANGRSCPKPLSAKALKKFGEQLDKITLELAKNLVADGEGATKLIEIEIRRAKSKADAKKVAQTIANSPLFKTAMFGADANWGRVLAAMGRSGVNFDPNKVDIYMAGLNVFKKGKPLKIDEKKAKILLSAKNIKVAADLNNGKESATYYTCDLSYDYVKINGDYRS